MATLNIGDYNMLDLKNYSNEELQELRYSIDKELFNRNGDTSFSEYKVGEVYCQSRGVNNHTFFYNGRGKIRFCLFLHGYHLPYKQIQE